MTDTTAEGSRDSLVILLVGAAHFLSHFYQLALPPTFPLLAEDFGVSFMALGSLTAVFFVFSGLFQAFVGIWVDKFGARPVLLGGLALLAASILLTGFATDYWMLIVLSALAGTGNSVFHPADLAILSLKVRPTRLGRAYAVHGFTGSLGYASAPLVVGALAAAAGWRVALVAVGLIGLVAVLALLSSGDSLATDGQESGEGGSEASQYGHLVRSPPLLYAFGYFMLTAMAIIGLQSFSITALVEMNGVVLAAAAVALSTYLFGSAAGMLVGGWLADRSPNHHGIAMAGMALAAGFMTLVAIIPMPFTGVLVLMALGGACAGATGPSRDLIVRRAAPPGATGKVFGLVYSGLDVGAALVPSAFGRLMDIGEPRMIFLAIAGFMLLAVLTVRNVRAHRAAPA
jgi:MFS family permease